MSAPPPQSTSAPRNAVVKPVAVIDIGATSIRMAIAEVDDAGHARILDTFSRAVNLGKDTFTRGSIHKSSVEECVRVLKTYKRALEEYQIVNPEQIRVVATSAVREASNRLAFLDRIYIATGLQIEALDEAEVNRITYLAIQQYLKSEPGIADGNVMIFEVGGGSTELLVVSGGKVTFSHTYRLGSLRMRKTLEAFRAPSVKVRTIMETQIRRIVEQICDQVPRDNKVQMIALGGDVRFAAAHLEPGWNPQSVIRVSVADLESLTDRFLNLTEDEIVRKYHLSFPEAETVGPALLAYCRLARAFSLDHVLVTNINLRDGLLQEMVAKEAWNEEFRAQIIQSALDLGRKFDFDQAHAQHVAELSKMLFQELQNEHGLDPRYEIILYVGALLHEIGAYISHRSMHKHSMYLIQNSELFGLGKKDVLLVSLVARYHRRASPKAEHEGYAQLTRDERVATVKMAALLRVATALDESRSQRIKEFRCRPENGRLVVLIPNMEDLALEQLALRQNGSLFEEIFGMQVLLRALRP